MSAQTHHHIQQVTPAVIWELLGLSVEPNGLPGRYVYLCAGCGQVRACRKHAVSAYHQTRWLACGICHSRSLLLQAKPVAARPRRPGCFHRPDLAWRRQRRLAIFVKHNGALPCDNNAASAARSHGR